MLRYRSSAVVSDPPAWYWAREPKEAKLQTVTLRWALGRVFRCHLASLALLALYMLLLYPARAVERVVNLLLPGSASPRSTALAYRPGAICQIALHGAKLRSAALAAHQLKLRNADVVGRCLGASGSVLFAGSVCTVGRCMSTDPRLTRDPGSPRMFVLLKLKCDDRFQTLLPMSSCARTARSV